MVSPKYEYLSSNWLEPESLPKPNSYATLSNKLL